MRHATLPRWQRTPSALSPDRTPTGRRTLRMTIPKRSASPLRDSIATTNLAGRMTGRTLRKDNTLKHDR